MKSIQTLFVAFFLISLNCDTLEAQSETMNQRPIQDTYFATFECESCTKKNKFLIAGPEGHRFRGVDFPLTQELKPGTYKMTYWQNRVQQIHLPFTISPNSENVIIVKE